MTDASGAFRFLTVNCDYCEVIDEKAENVLSVATLRTGRGRVWQNDGAILVESALVPGEPQGFGDPQALLSLLEEADGWTCVEVTNDLARRIASEFEQRFGLTRQVIDIIHTLDRPVDPLDHALVRQVTAADLTAMRVASEDLLPQLDVVRHAAGVGRVFGAFDDDLLVGHGSSLAWGDRFADIGVHVAEKYRRKGIAKSAASRACHAVRADGLTPVWGCGAHNEASLAVANRLGFEEIARLTFLVRGASEPPK